MHNMMVEAQLENDEMENGSMLTQLMLCEKMKVGTVIIKSTRMEFLTMKMWKMDKEPRMVV